LLREIGFEISVKVVKRRMFLANFSPGATSSIMVVHSIVLPTMLTMQFGYCFLKYWWWYYGCWFITFMVERMHVALTLRLIKLWENIHWYLQVQDYVMKERKIKDLEDFLLSFRLYYFVINEDNSCISQCTIFYSKHMWYWLLKKSTC
jgi:hypothetical protein